MHAVNWFPDQQKSIDFITVTRHYFVVGCVLVASLSSVQARADFTLSTGRPEMNDESKALAVKVLEPIKNTGGGVVVMPAEPRRDAAGSLLRAEALKKESDDALMEAESRARAEKEAADAVLRRADMLKSKLPPVVNATAVLSGAAIASAATSTPRSTDDVEVMVFDVRRTDGTLRNTVQRWAKSAGWQPFWQVERDFVAEAGAPLGTEFRGAIRSLMSATSGSDIEVKACFHSNFVVRIVRKSVDCTSTPHINIFPGGK